MLAVENGNGDSIRLLLGAGADIDATNSVSKRVSICLAHVCVCVIFYHRSV